MRIAILHNRDSDLLEDDPGREAREEVEQVARLLALELTGPGREVELIGVDSDVFSFGPKLAAARADVVVNLCESLAADSRGEMVVPALLELLGTALHRLVRARARPRAAQGQGEGGAARPAGVPTPDFCVVESVAEVPQVKLPYPLIVKPAREDASVGVDFDSVVHDRAALGRAVAQGGAAPSTSRRWWSASSTAARSTCRCSATARGARCRSPRSLRQGLRPAPQARLLPRQVGRGVARVHRQPLAALHARRRHPAALRRGRLRRLRGARLPRLRPGRPAGGARRRLPASSTSTPTATSTRNAGFAKAALEAGIAYGDLALHLLELALERTHGNPAPRRTGPAAARRAARAASKPSRRTRCVRARADRARAHAEQP